VTRLGAMLIESAYHAECVTLEQQHTLVRARATWVLAGLRGDDLVDAVEWLEQRFGRWT
jgi:hypothetical protein